MNLTYLIRRPVITEKSLKQASTGQYVFAVDPAATKGQIKAAIGQQFKVTVKEVKTSNVPGKVRHQPRRRTTYQTPNWKKAIVQLAAGQTIDLFTTQDTTSAAPAKTEKFKKATKKAATKKEESK